MKAKTDVVKVLIADDSEIIRRRLRSLLEGISRVEIVGEAADTGETIRAVGKLRPDAVVLDLGMPGGGGLEVLRQVKRMAGAPTVIILTNYAEALYRRSATAQGANFFLDKSTEFEKVAEILQTLTAQRQGGRSQQKKQGESSHE
ncbi:MAG: response regulator transcription factor [Verrucomicrobiae bacterium]|nr:response regulator transcription factor [Verrucomicrobiae bacterium]